MFIFAVIILMTVQNLVTEDVIKSWALCAMSVTEMLDVTKQKDLSGFYRYLYRETTGKAADEPSTAQQDR